MVDQALTGEFQVDANNYANGASRPAALDDYKFRVYAPQTAGTYKTIVFSHGGNSTPKNIDYLADYWTSNGYIVIAPYHADSSGALYTENNVKNNLSLFGNDGDAEITHFRAQDLSIALDIATANAPTSQGGGGGSLTIDGKSYQFDITTPVVSGYSRGSSSSQIAAGARPTINGVTYTNWGDSRFEALMNLTGVGPDESAMGNISKIFAPEAWDNITMPWLLVSGSVDHAPGSNDPGDRLEPIFSAPDPSDTKHAVFINGAGHRSFGEPTDTVEPLNDPIFAQSVNATTSFLKAYVEGNTTERANLQAIDVADSSIKTDGADSITGGSGNDTLFGRAGNDTLKGGDGEDQLFGMRDNDRLWGEAGNDTLNGGFGVDTLRGGAGADNLAGGDGNDIFEYTSLSDSGITSTTWDVIADFDIFGNDKIDLSAIDAITGGGGSNDQFTYRGTSSFTAAGQLRVVSSGDGGVLVHLNTDSNLSTIEMTIKLLDTGTGSMSSGDFML